MAVGAKCGGATGGGCGNCRPRMCIENGCAIRTKREQCMTQFLYDRMELSAIVVLV